MYTAGLMYRKIATLTGPRRLVRTLGRLALFSLLTLPSAVGSFGVAITALTVAACGGGGDDSLPTVPLLAWPRDRRSDQNTAISSVDIGENEGRAELAYAFNTDQTPSRISPIMGRDSFVYVGLAEGLLSLEEPTDISEDEIELVERWELDSCGEAALQSVSSVTVSPDGLTLIVASADDSAAGGSVFRLLETEDGDGVPECPLAVQLGSRSPALIAVDQFFLDFISFTLGTTSGRLTSIDSGGARRWSFPENEPFAESISSSPAVLDNGFVFASPDGRLHSVDQSGRARWSTVIGGPYSDDESVPSPTVFNQIFTVNAAGDVVAFTPTGAQLWTFSPGEDRDIVGSVAVNLLTTEGGAFLNENVVFAIDRQGTAYGIGALTGELVRFCEYENRACLPSSCEENEGECVETMRCSETTERPCGDGEPDCPDGESCTEQFFCDQNPERACFRDFCITDDDVDNPTNSDRDGRCNREARMPLTSMAAEFATDPIVSIDGFVVAATTDGRVCARRLDGAIPNGTCPDSGDPCAVDTCPGDGDACCGPNDVGCTPGHCKADPTLACSLDTCLRERESRPCSVGDNQERNWIDGDGCVDLGDAGSTIISHPIIGSDGEIIVTTERGVAIVK